VLVAPLAVCVIDIERDRDSNACVEPGSLRPRAEAVERRVAASLLVGLPLRLR
jgi:hypothetical protein